MAGAVFSASADCKIDKILYFIGDMLDFYPAKIAEVGNGGVFVANFLFCHSILLCGLYRDLFDGSVGVRQPDFVDIVQNGFARLMVVFAVTLQDFVTARRVFERHERYIRAILCADKEDERFFSHHALVVVHSAHAMVQRFSLTDKVSRTSCDDADKRAPFCVLQGQVFLRNGGELRVQFFALFRIFHSLFRGVFVDSDIVPASEFVGINVLVFCHINAEIPAGFQIVEISVRIGLLFCYIIKKPFKVFAFEQFFYRFEVVVVNEFEFCFLV